MSFAPATGKKAKRPFSPIMSVEVIKTALKDYARDIRINIGNILTREDSPGLTEKQIFGCAISTAIALKNSFLTKHLLLSAKSLITDQDLSGIKTAVSLMGMNNIYYRTLHLAEDKELSQRPARLRMTMMRNHGLDQKDFEIYALAVSVLFGCGMCIKSHTAKLKQEGLSTSAVQSIIRISAVIHGAHQSLNPEIDGLS